MLSVDINEAQVDQIAREFAATPNQIKDAYSKALTRTSGTLRKAIVPGLVSELGLKNGKMLRRRLKLYKNRGANRSSVKIWVGAGGMHYSDFKGRWVRTRQGIKVGDDLIIGGFAGTSAFTGRREVFTRKGRDRLPLKLEKKAISGRVVAFLDENVFIDIEAIFFKHFQHEIKARTIFGVGRK